MEKTEYRIESTGDKALNSSSSGDKSISPSQSASPSSVDGSAPPPNYSRVILSDPDETLSVDVPPSYHTTKRNLKGRHIQLIGIGGAIGTVLFVQLGEALTWGGPGSLFIAFTIWCFPVLCVTACAAEFVTYLPISSPFIRLSGRFVEPAVEVMAGWNFFFFQATLVPFEITAVNLIINYWVSDYSPAITLAIQISLYLAINVFAVQWYGESEFWLSIGKVILAVGLIFFTFITMVGGNPQHDAYGFTYWNTEGAPFAPYIERGSIGRFIGFLACLVEACYTICGPEYVSMAAGEAENPRKIMPKAYRGVLLRLSCFFVMGALSIGIVCPYNDSELLAAINDGAPGAAASPYIIAMQRMKISVLPDIVNTLILTASFSAGNSYTYCASRTLYGMALDGKAPRIFAKCTKRGVPLPAVLVTLCFGLLAFLQLGNTASTVLTWIVNLGTASELINFCVITLTYLRFYYALKAQGISRDTLPFKVPFQPYAGYIGLICPFIMMFITGFEVFLKGNWSLSTFLFSYIMIGVDVVIYLFWKIFKKSKILPLRDVDLITGTREIEEYTENYVEKPPKTWFEKISRSLLG